MAWEWRENNREKVLEALRKGEYEAILTSREGALDALTHLACELEVLEAVELIEVERDREGIPDGMLLRTLAILPFVEAMSLSAAANTLFKDAAVLLQLGYTAIQIQEGFNQRRGKQYKEKSAQSRPYHPDVMRNELQRIKVESLDAYRRHCIGVLYKRGLIRSKLYAVDGSGIALKHGIYSRAFTKEEQREWLSPAKGGLQPEINLFKILIARTTRMLKPLDEDSAPSFHESVAALYVVSMAVSRLNSFYCTNEKLYAANDANLIEFCTSLGFTQEQIEMELYGPPEKTRGGQLGNTNALKYGFYASVFKPGEIRKLEKITKAELNDEVALLRVLIKRTVVSMNDLSNLDIMDYLRGIRVITFAGACVEKLERTRKLVFDEPVTLGKLLTQAIDEVNAERKAKGLGSLDPREER